MRQPKGALGVKWGDDAASAADKLSIVSRQWASWEGGQGFETCIDFDHLVHAFEMEAIARLIRHGSNLEGLQLIFQNCADRWDELFDSVCREFDLSVDSKTDIYVTWGSGEAIHLIHDESFRVCTLTIAGARFGLAYAGYVLGRGFGTLATSLKP
jgi:hypothetical protein